MLNREELRELAGFKGNGAYFVSLYLNVNPVTNPGGEFAVWLKSSLKAKADSLEKDVLKKAEKDLRAIEAYVLGNRKDLKRALILLSSSASGLWKEYNLNVPVKNELVVEKTPYIKPLLEVFDNYERYAVLLVEKEEARIFVIQLGEIAEHGEVSTLNVPGKNKKGGWFALQQDHFARHVDSHVTLHLEDAVKKFESFLKGETINRFLIGGSDEAVSMVRGLLPKTITDKIIGTFRAGMFEDNASILKRAEPVLQAVERREEEKTVSELIAKAKKNERAVIGMEDVLAMLQEGRVMRLVLLRDLSLTGFRCPDCHALMAVDGTNCRYCGGGLERVNYLSDLAAQKAVEQNALVEFVPESNTLKEAGGIGAFLRF